MEMTKCPICGTDKLFWMSDENAAAVFGIYDEDDDAICHYYHCANCGTDVTVVEPPREDRENAYRDYWIDKETAD